MSFLKQFSITIASLVLTVSSSWAALTIDSVSSNSFSAGCLSDSCAIVSTINTLARDSRNNEYLCMKNYRYESGASYNHQVVVTKSDAFKNVLWSRALADTLKCNAVSMLLDADGSAYVAGCGYGAIYVTNSVFLTKVGADGRVLWTITTAINGRGPAIGLNMESLILRFDADRNVIIAVNEGGSDVLKISGAGQLLWSVSVAPLYMHGLVVTPANKLYVQGTGGTMTSGDMPATLVKIDMATGVVDWRKPDNSIRGWYLDMTADASGFLYLRNGLTVQKFNEAGVLQQNLTCASLALAGNVNVLANGGLWAGLQRFDANGSLAATAVSRHAGYNHNGMGFPVRTKVDGLGNLVIFTPMDLSRGDSSFIEIFSDNGEFLFEKSFVVKGGYTAMDLYIRTLEKLYRGQSGTVLYNILVISKGSTQGATVELSVSGAATPAETRMSGQALTLACIPNPLNPGADILFNTRAYGNVSMVVYDINGRAVRTLIDGKLAAGSHAVHFNAGKLSAGNYVCRLQTGRQSRSLTVKLSK